MSSQISKESSLLLHDMTRAAAKNDSELPSNLIIKKASPKIWLPFITAMWGIITMCLGFVRGFGSFVAVRCLLGIMEGGLLPGMVFPSIPGTLGWLITDRQTRCCICPRSTVEAN